MPERPEDPPRPVPSSGPNFAPVPRGTSSVAPQSARSFPAEPAEDEGFPLAVLPALLDGHRCGNHPEAPCSTACRVACVVGGDPAGPSCDEAIPRRLPAILASGLDLAPGAALPRALAAAPARATYNRETAGGPAAPGAIIGSGLPSSPSDGTTGARPGR